TFRAGALTVSSLFPYTTLFRSGARQFLVTLGMIALLVPFFWLAGWLDRWSLYATAILIAASGGVFAASEHRIASMLGWARVSPRSEEHTSELQSLTNLVCRLLL